MNVSQPSQRPGGVNVFWWVCTKNPFYAVSAVLVLLGLWISFGDPTDELQTWLLVGGMTAYTLLLAVTAVVLVRFLKLWDDARTVMLLVVLMFLGTSVTFDNVLMQEDPGRGAIFYLLGLGLSVAISEMLLRCIKLRLPALYRVPYYLMLTVFFLYPLFVRALMDPQRPDQEPLMWGLFGFSTAAGLAALTLLPALWRGPDYVRGNGSPWPWPLYPWSLFVMLAIAVPGRAVLMCWSLHPLDNNRFNQLIFGPYFLVPFGFALALLILEFGAKLANKAMVRLALLLPLALMGLALLGHAPSDPVFRILRVMTVSIGEYRAFAKVSLAPDPVYDKFLGLFTARLGADPLFLTLLLSACFYGYAALRRVPLALEALSAALAAMAVIGTTTWTEGRLLDPIEPGPLLAPAVILLSLGAHQRSPWNLLRGAACLAGAAALVVPLPEPVIPGLRAVIFIHLTLLAMLGLGAIFAKTSGIYIRRIGAGFILVIAMASMYPWYVTDGIPETLPIVYPLCMGLLLGLYGHVLGDSWILVMATVLLGYWVFKFGWTAYRAVRGSNKGFDYLVSGLGFFMVAVLVSLGKSGHLFRWIDSHWTLPAWIRTMIRPVPALAQASIQPALEGAATATPAEESSAKPEADKPSGGA